MGFLLLVSLTVLTANIAGAQVGSVVHLRSQNYPNYVWGLRSNGDAYINQGFSGHPFHVVQGLTGQAGTVSFNSIDYPCSYLRHYGYYVNLESSKNPRNPDIYDQDATFYPRVNKYFPGYTAYESVNYPGYFIRHAGYRLQIRQDDGSLLFKKDASFKPESIDILERCAP